MTRLSSGWCTDRSMDKCVRRVVRGPCGSRARRCEPRRASRSWCSPGPRSRGAPAGAQPRRVDEHPVGVRRLGVEAVSAQHVDQLRPQRRMRADHAAEGRQRARRSGSAVTASPLTAHWAGAVDSGPDRRRSPRATRTYPTRSPGHARSLVSEPTTTASGSPRVHDPVASA